MTKKDTYWQTLRSGIRSSLKGLRLSMRHFRAAHQRHAPTNVQDPLYFDHATGMVTLRYPTEVIPVPDHGRYRLHNEMDDCIVCDKCAKICPVDCIEIEPIRATEEVGRASDGSPIRLYAAKFDIDMAKCCYCGLCTTVCPTECLTMTKTYDFSEFDVRDFNYHFANISPDVAEEKRQLYEQFVAEKAGSKEQGARGNETGEAPKPAARPVFKPSFKKPATELTSPAEEATAALSAEPPLSDEQPKPRPVFKPTMKKPAPVEEKTEEPPAAPEPAEPAAEPPKPRPVFKPTFKKPPSAEAASPTEPAPESAPTPPKPRPVFKPTYKKPPTEPTDPA